MNIVDQLRSFVSDDEDDEIMTHDAVDEIERLREQVAYREKTIAMQRAEIERLIGVRRG